MTMRNIQINIKIAIQALFFICIFSLSACSPISSNLPSIPPWTYADLKSLDPADAESPSQDLVALYTRTIGAEVQFRLDLLDITPDRGDDFYLVLDTTVGGTRSLPINAATSFDWDVLVVIPAIGPIRTYDSQYKPILNMKIRIVRDPLIDTIVITLNKLAIPDSFSIFTTQVFLVPPGSRIPVDSIGPIRSDAVPPPSTRILIAFWDTLTANTPAQALRHWNGAHSGPLGKRHGLLNLLNAVSATRVPIVLLDLKSPVSLSALDYLSVLPQVQNLSERGLLILPDYAPIYLPSLSPNGGADVILDQLISRGAIESRQASKSLRLPSSTILFSPQVSLKENQNYRVIFTKGQWSGHAQKYGNAIIYPIPAFTYISVSQTPPPDLQEATSDGLSIETRRTLLQGALSNTSGQQPDITLLGGDFEQSTWGYSDMAYNTMHYIASHPWMQVMTLDDLSNAYTQENFSVQTATESLSTVPHTSQGSLIPSSMTSDQLLLALLEKLNQSPPNPITDLAWQAYLSLLAPAPQKLYELRMNYLGQIGHILAAAQWATHQVLQSDCTTDLDWDGQAECVLASKDFFSIYEVDGARLTFAFVRTSSGVHQLIGPTSQLIVGLSDPSTWDPERGPAGEPNQIPGGFVDSTLTWQDYNVEIQPGSVSFTSPDMTMRKSFYLIPDGIRVIYQSREPLKVQIPLVIDPWVRFTPGWGNRYMEMSTSTGWSWGLNPGPRVTLQTTGNLITQTFTASRSALALPEDPNFDYTAGHYLPFPLALAEIFSQGDFSIEIHLTP